MRLLLLLTIVLQSLNCIPAREDPAIIFSQNAVQLTFPKVAAFSASISGDEKITDVELIYGTDERTCSEVQALAIPEFTPGKQVRASWKWEMEDSGSLPPGTEIWWKWKATDENGDTVTTEKKTIIWIDKSHPWQVKEKDNIRLHYYQINEPLVNEFLDAAISAQDRLKADTGMTASGTVDIYMYRNNRDMLDAILYEQSWTGAMAYTDANKIIIGFDSGNLDWVKHTIAHELAHVLSANYTFTCLSMTPTWLEEGLAVYAEGPADDNTRDTFEKAKERNDLLSFHILSASFSADSETAGLSYSQSYYMVKYLIDRYGREKINKLLITLADGITVDGALKEVYGFDLYGFEKEWRKSEALPIVEELIEAEKPTASPTQIPTLQPIAGHKKVNPTSTGTPIPTTITSPSATPTRETTLTTTMAVKTLIPINTPIQPGTSGHNGTIVLLAVMGVLIIGVVAFVVIRSKNRKNTITTILVVLFLSSALLTEKPVQAGNPAAEPTKYPPMPTATAYTPPPTPEGYYTDYTNGISLKIPPLARIDATNRNTYFHFTIRIDGDTVFGFMFSSSLGQGENLHDIAENDRNSVMEDLDLIEVEYLEDKEIGMNDGTKGWLSILDARVSGGVQKNRFSLLTVKGYTSATTLVLFSSPDSFESYRDVIDNLNTSIQVIAPKIQGYARDELLILNGSESDNPQENDPATSVSSGNFGLVFSGLVTYDSSMNVVPDLASSWDVSDDGRVYTFHLQPDAVFHNTRPVTADDVVYSWERAARPATESKTVLTYMGDIQGIKDMHEGKTEHITGLKVIDEHTLEVSLEKPVPYFLLKLTFPTSFIVDKENVESGKAWYRLPNGTGPYRLIRKESRKFDLFERFESFYGDKPKIKAILRLLYSGTSLQLYEEGAIDMTGISDSDLFRFNDPTEPMHDQLTSSTNMCTSYITLDVSRPPFDDLKVRQAFAMAVDKEKLAQVILHDSALPAKSLYPPALPGFDSEFQGLEYNPGKARELLKESTYGSGNMPPVIFTSAGYGNAVDNTLSAISRMWEENLGVKVILQNIDPEYYQDVLDSENHGQLISEGWCADYPDPENFADVLFHSGSAMNRANYSNPELDKLLEDARVEEDVNKRMEKYRKAERIIVNDAPAIFLVHFNSYTLVKPYLKGYIGTPIDIPFERYLWIDNQEFTR